MFRREDRQGVHSKLNQRLTGGGGMMWSTTWRSGKLHSKNTCCIYVDFPVFLGSGFYHTFFICKRLVGYRCIFSMKKLVTWSMGPPAWRVLFWHDDRRPANGQQCPSYSGSCLPTSLVCPCESASLHPMSFWKLSTCWEIRWKKKGKNEVGTVGLHYARSWFATVTFPSGLWCRQSTPV